MSTEIKPLSETTILNPNDKVVAAITKRLIITEGYCPCNQVGVDKEDTLCPCKKYKETDYCCCGLYVKK